MKKDLLLLFTFLLVFIVNCFSQSIAISGKIKGNNNEPLSGVAITVKGQVDGTATNDNGAFTLSVSNNAVLIISHVGYTSKEVLVNGKTFIEESLQQQNQQLGSVIARRSKGIRS